MHRYDREERDVEGVVEVVVADDDVRHVLGPDPELAQRTQDEIAVGDHARIHDDDASGVPDEAHRARHMGHADVALDEDVQAGRSREFGHAADASNSARGRPVSRAMRDRGAGRRG